MRKQTSTDLPIVKTMDLSRGKGDEVEFQFLQPVGALPDHGQRDRRGQGHRLSDTPPVRVNQARFPVDPATITTTIRSAVDFRRLGRLVAQSLMDSYMDQSLLVHGWRAWFHDNIESGAFPVAALPEVCRHGGEPRQGPTKNRHFIADGTNGIIPFTNAGDVDIATTDVLSMDVVDAIRTTMGRSPCRRRPSRSPVTWWPKTRRCASRWRAPAQYHSFAQDPNFRQFQANALARASKAGSTRCSWASVGCGTASSSAKMPKADPLLRGRRHQLLHQPHRRDRGDRDGAAGFGTTHAIDRAILLGGQAIAQAFAASGHGGMPLLLKEKEFDHDDKMELLIGAIQGISKVRWLVDQGNGVKHYTDHGIVAIDTAVPIIAARQ